MERIIISYGTAYLLIKLRIVQRTTSNLPSLSLRSSFFIQDRRTKFPSSKYLLSHIPLIERIPKLPCASIKQQR